MFLSIDKFLPTGLYVFENVRIQDSGLMEGVSDPVTEHPGIRLRMETLSIEGGGQAKGSSLTMNLINITVRYDTCLLL